MNSYKDSKNIFSNFKIENLDLEKEAVYLNALNLYFQKNFLKIYSFLKEYPSFSSAFSSIEKKENIKIDPLKEWQKLKKTNIEFIPFWEKCYPNLLKEIPNPPLALYFLSKIFSKNNLSEIFSQYPSLAIVGTRKISEYGNKVTEKIIQELKNFNFLIISGLAYGVDACVHKNCLKNEIFNFAILASGLTNITPSSHFPLAKKIINKGGLISEYPLNTPSLKQYFPWRNRIISGLSLGVLIIEAPLKSGALITAHFALEQNREIFAVPGSIFNQKSSGCHLLIKNGVKLVEKAEDIIEDLMYYHPGLQEKIKDSCFKNNSFPIELTEKEKQILDILSREKPFSLDKILEKVNLKPTEVLSILSELELKGLVKENQGLYTKIYN